MFEMREARARARACGRNNPRGGAPAAKDDDVEEDYGDDIITDDDIARLMIVQRGKGHGKGRDEASAWTGYDQRAGLRFYQKELKRGGQPIPNGGQSGSWRQARTSMGSSWKGGNGFGSSVGQAHFFPPSYKEGGAAGWV